MTVNNCPSRRCGTGLRPDGGRDGRSCSSCSGLPSKGKFEWNFNTLLQLGQIAVLIVGGVTIWVNRSRDIARATVAGLFFGGC